MDLAKFLGVKNSNSNNNAMTVIGNNNEPENIANENEQFEIENIKPVKNSTNTIKNSNYIPLGSGSYGMVIKPALYNLNRRTRKRVNFPTHVTKIYKDKRTYNGAMKLNGNMLNSIIGPNESHHMYPYSRPLKGKNIPSYVRSYLNAGPEKNIYAAHMPYLGVDFARLRSPSMSNALKQVQQGDVHVIISQTVKLLIQVNNILANGYIHGDIRSTNLMIEPNTGIMTLIDFDWLKTRINFKDSYPFDGFYCTPPELAIFCIVPYMYHAFRKRPELKTAENVIKIIDMDDTPKERPQYIENYISGLKTDFTYVFRRHPEFKTFLNDTIKSNVQFMNYFAPIMVYYDKTFDASFDTYDSFGLSNSLVQLYDLIYKDSVGLSEEGLKNNLREQMATTTPEEYDACIHAIYRMLHEVLLPLADFDIRYRLRIGDAVQRAAQIEKELYEGKMGGKRKVNHRKQSHKKGKTAKRR